MGYFDQFTKSEILDDLRKSHSEQPVFANLVHYLYEKLETLEIQNEELKKVASTLKEENRQRNQELSQEKAKHEYELHQLNEIYRKQASKAEFNLVLGRGLESENEILSSENRALKDSTSELEATIKSLQEQNESLDFSLEQSKITLSEMSVVQNNNEDLLTTLEITEGINSLALNAPVFLSRLSNCIAEAVQGAVPVQRQVNSFYEPIPELKPLSRTVSTLVTYGQPETSVSSSKSFSLRHHSDLSRKEREKETIRHKIRKNLKLGKIGKSSHRHLLVR